MKVTLAIPVYNSAKILEACYAALKDCMDKIGIDYEIIFRNDGSNDNSQEVLEGIAGRDQRVKAFFHSPNRGLGYTLRKLFKEATGDVIVYLDADLSFGLDIMPKFLEQIKKVDVVIASRYAGSYKELPLKREVTSRIYYLICKFLFDVDVKDLGSGFVVFKKEAVSNLNLVSDGFDIHVEIFARMKKKGFITKEIPVSYFHDDEAGTFGIIKHGPKILIKTFNLWWKINKK